MTEPNCQPGGWEIPSDKGEHRNSYVSEAVPTIPHKNNETNDKFYREVEFIMYAEMVNFRPQILKAALKQKTHRGLGTTLPSS